MIFKTRSRFSTQTNEGIITPQYLLVHPRPSFTEEPSARCSPLPEDGAVLRVDLFQHAVVPQVLLSATAAKWLHKLLLRLRDNTSMCD